MKKTLFIFTIRFKATKDNIGDRLKAYSIPAQQKAVDVDSKCCRLFKKYNKHI